MGWQDELPDKITEFLKEFGINFAKYYAISLLAKAQRNIESSNEDARHLSYRDWESIESGNLLKGTVFMREGDGAASWRAWKARYVVQTSDYNFHVYNSDKDYEKAKDKPALKIGVAGYTFLSSTQSYYLQEGRAVAAELGGSDPEIGHSSYAWGLAHPTRPQYMFQLHKGKNAACACVGGNVVEPEEAGSEFANQREEWVAAFEECTKKACPRDVEGDVIADTFERLKNKMIKTMSELEGHTLDGTEGEILADMIYLCVLEASVKSEIIENIQQLPPAFRYPAWIKAKALGVKIISTAVPPAWTKIQEQMSGLNAKIEPKITSKLEIILGIKQKIKDKIIEVIGSKTGEVLGKHISPHLKPMFDALDVPLQDGLKAGRHIFKQKCMEAKSKSKADRNKCLDGIPRDDKNVKPLKEAAKTLTDPISKLKKVDEEVFQDLDPASIRSAAESVMLEIMDAACFTLEESLDASGAPDFDTCVEMVLKKYDKDINSQRATWMKSTINGIVAGFFSRTVGSYADDLLDPLLSEIPEDLNEFFDIKAELDSVIYGSLAEVINKFVDGAYPCEAPPEKEAEAAPEAEPEAAEE